MRRLSFTQRLQARLGRATPAEVEARLLTLLTIGRVSASQVVRGYSGLLKRTRRMPDLPAPRKTVPVQNSAFVQHVAVAAGTSATPSTLLANTPGTFRADATEQAIEEFLCWSTVYRATRHPDRL